MKHVKKYEDPFDFLPNDYDPKNPFETELMNGATLGDLNRVKKALKNGEDIDYQKKGDNITALIMAAYKCNYDIVDYLIKKGANWNLKDITGKDFVDMIIEQGELDYFIKKYPVQYKNYLLKKEAEKYNL